MVDQVENFVRGETDEPISESDTTISVVDAEVFPDPTSGGQYNLVLWGGGGRPDEDSNAEIIRVTDRDTGANSLLVERGQEGTTDVSHPTESALQLSPTAKTITDIDTGKANDPHDNESHSETFAVDGDTQPPETHDNESHSETYLTQNDVLDIRRESVQRTFDGSQELIFEPSLSTGETIIGWSYNSEDNERLAVSESGPDLELGSINEAGSVRIFNGSSDNITATVEYIILS